MNGRAGACYRTGRAEMSDELTDAEYLELNRLQVLIGQERLAAVVVPVLERLAQAPSVPVHPLVGLY